MNSYAIAEFIMGAMAIFAGVIIAVTPIWIISIPFFIVGLYAICLGILILD